MLIATIISYQILVCAATLCNSCYYHFTTLVCGILGAHSQGACYTLLCNNREHDTNSIIKIIHYHPMSKSYLVTGNTNYNNAGHNLTIYGRMVTA